jgi:hypothetical protein
MLVRSTQRAPYLSVNVLTAAHAGVHPGLH